MGKSADPGVDGLMASSANSLLSSSLEYDGIYWSVYSYCNAFGASVVTNLASVVYGANAEG